MYTNVVENWPDFLICRMKECTALWSKTGQNFSNVEWKNVQQCGWGDSQHKLNNSCIPGFKIHCGLHGFLKKWYQRWYTVLKVMENYWTTNKSQVVVKGWVGKRVTNYFSNPFLLQAIPRPAAVCEVGSRDQHATPRPTTAPIRRMWERWGKEAVVHPGGDSATSNCGYRSAGRQGHNDDWMAEACLAFVRHAVRSSRLHLLGGACDHILDCDTCTGNSLVKMPHICPSILAFVLDVCL